MQICECVDRERGLKLLFKQKRDYRGSLDSSFFLFSVLLLQFLCILYPEINYVWCSSRSRAEGESLFCGDVVAECVVIVTIAVGPAPPAKSC